MLTNAINAQDSSDDVEHIEISEVNTYQSLNYQSINRAEFVNTAQTLTDVLQNVNGIQLNSVTGVGNPVSVSIRGSSSKQVQVYVDGLLINDEQFGGFDLNMVPLEQIESIEVAKNESLGFASTPIGGVIRINTLRESGSGYRLSTKVGSFGYKQATLSLHSQFSKHQVSFNIDALRTDNDYSTIVPQPFTDPNSPNEEKIKNNEFSQYSISLSDEFNLGVHEFRLTTQWDDKSKSIPNYQNNNPVNNRKLDSKSQRLGLYYETSFQHNLIKNLISGVNWLKREELFYDSPHVNKNDLFLYENQSLGAFSRLPISINQLLITPHINFSHYRFGSETLRGTVVKCGGIGACDIKAERNSLELGGRIEWTSTDGELSLYSAVTSSHNKDKNMPRRADEQGRVESSEQYSSGEFGSNFRFNNYLFNASFSRGLRMPSMYELFGDRGQMKGNDELTPELSNTISLNTKWSNANSNVNLSLYHRNLSNSIVPIFSSEGVGSFRNVSSAEVVGVELDSSWTFSPQFTAMAKLSLIDSEIESDLVAFDGNKLPGTYGKQFSTSLIWRAAADLNFRFDAFTNRDMHFNRPNLSDNSTSGFGNGNPADSNTFDFSANYRFKKVNLSLLAKNVFSDKYKDLANRPSEGRNIFLKLSYRD
ncbi:TonB-dependent receptor [Saccharobesus litoralis]|uniref:TonB-dependent receptor n=1 Tax=Saccharobesus litoralis TaxID=2172099 RepID=UPI00131EE032|nr:TonB-dependent receptor [Saccharobesus litoralis]